MSHAEMKGLETSSQEEIERGLFHAMCTQMRMSELSPDEAESFNQQFLRYASNSQKIQSILRSLAPYVDVIMNKKREDGEVLEGLLKRYFEAQEVRGYGNDPGKEIVGHTSFSGSLNVIEQDLSIDKKNATNITVSECEKQNKNLQFYITELHRMQKAYVPKDSLQSPEPMMDDKTVIRSLSETDQVFVYLLQSKDEDGRANILAVPDVLSEQEADDCRNLTLARGRNTLMQLRVLRRNKEGSSRIEIKLLEQLRGEETTDGIVEEISINQRIKQIEIQQKDFQEPYPNNLSQLLPLNAPRYLRDYPHSSELFRRYKNTKILEDMRKKVSQTTTSTLQAVKNYRKLKHLWMLASLRESISEKVKDLKQAQGSGYDPGVSKTVHSVLKPYMKGTTLLTMYERYTDGVGRNLEPLTRVTQDYFSVFGSQEDTADATHSAPLMDFTDRKIERAMEYLSVSDEAVIRQLLQLPSQEIANESSEVTQRVALVLEHQRRRFFEGTRAKVTAVVAASVALVGAWLAMNLPNRGTENGDVAAATKPAEHPSFTPNSYPPIVGDTSIARTVYEIGDSTDHCTNPLNSGFASGFPSYAPERLIVRKETERNRTELNHLDMDTRTRVVAPTERHEPVVPTVSSGVFGEIQPGIMPEVTYDSTPIEPANMSGKRTPSQSIASEMERTADSENSAHSLSSTLARRVETPLSLVLDTETPSRKRMKSTFASPTVPSLAVLPTVAEAPKATLETLEKELADLVKEVRAKIQNLSTEEKAAYAERVQELLKKVNEAKKSGKSDN